MFMFLPGSMFNPMTKGNLLRIQEGAKVVLNANDIFEDLLYLKLKITSCFIFLLLPLCNLFFNKNL